VNITHPHTTSFHDDCLHLFIPSIKTGLARKKLLDKTEANGLEDGIMHGFTYFLHQLSSCSAL